jgi:hypothetical protein
LPLPLISTVRFPRCTVAVWYCSAGVGSGPKTLINTKATTPHNTTPSTIFDTLFFINTLIAFNFIALTSPFVLPQLTVRNTMPAMRHETIRQLSNLTAPENWQKHGSAGKHQIRTNPFEYSASFFSIRCQPKTETLPGWH